MKASTTPLLAEMIADGEAGNNQERVSKFGDAWEHYGIVTPEITGRIGCHLDAQKSKIVRWLYFAAARVSMRPSTTPTMDAVPPSPFHNFKSNRAAAPGVPACMT